MSSSKVTVTSLQASKALSTAGIGISLHSTVMSSGNVSSITSESAVIVISSNRFPTELVEPCIALNKTTVEF